MKTMLKLFVVFVSLLGSILLAVKLKTPEFVETSSRSCPFSLNMAETPVMVVRVVDNSKLPKDFIKRCILNQMTEKNGIVFVNRENEPQILNELTHQSEIPASEDHVQPIGEILVPSHLYVINQKDSWVEISLSEVKSGIYVIKEEFQFNPLLEVLKNNSGIVFKFTIIGILFFSILLLINLPLRPVYRWLDHRTEVNSLNQKFRQAQYLISQNDIYTAGNLLVECAKSPFDCAAKASARSILNNLAKIIKD